MGACKWATGWPLKLGMGLQIVTGALLFNALWHGDALSMTSYSRGLTSGSVLYEPPAYLIAVADAQEINGHRIIPPDQLISRSTNTADTFDALHRERRWAIDQTQFLHDKLLSLAAASHERPIQIPTISAAEYNAKVSEIDAKIKQNERAQTDQSLEERQRVSAGLELDDLTRQKARLDLRMEETKAYDQAEADYQKLVQDEANSRRDYEAAEHYLFTIDDTINGLLVTTDKNNNFRLWMGGAFTLLIGLLISGFFLMAWKNKSIKEVFLSNDRGLQFITLFSLIIAIILFGVMNILEGRELAALLGGLSGYILGRSNLGNTPQPASGQEPENA
jgi:hypothetical protein